MQVGGDTNRGPYDELRAVADHAVMDTDISILDQMSDAFSLIRFGRVVHIQRLGKNAVVHWPHGESTEVTPASSARECTEMVLRAVRLLLDNADQL